MMPTQIANATSDVKRGFDLRNVFLMSVTFPHNSWTTRRLWTEAIYRVSRRGAVIDRGTVVVDGHIDLDGRCSTAAESIGDLECNRVHASIKVAVAFAPQLDRLAIRINHDVVQRVAIAAARIV